MKKEEFIYNRKVDVWWCDFCGKVMTIRHEIPKQNQKGRIFAYYRECKRCGKSMCDDCWKKQGKHDIGGMYSYGTGIRCLKCYKEAGQDRIKKIIKQHELEIKKLKIDLI